MSEPNTSLFVGLDPGAFLEDFFAEEKKLREDMIAMVKAAAESQKKVTLHSAKPMADKPNSAANQSADLGTVNAMCVETEKLKLTGILMTECISAKRKKGSRRRPDRNVNCYKKLLQNNKPAKAPKDCRSFDDIYADTLNKLTSLTYSDNDKNKAHSGNELGEEELAQLSHEVEVMMEKQTKEQSTTLNLPLNVNPMLYDARKYGADLTHKMIKNKLRFRKLRFSPFP